MRKTSFALLVLYVCTLPAIAQSAIEQEASQIQSILEREYEHKLISSGDNFPPFNLRRNHRADILALLHEGISVPAIQLHFGWDSTEMQTRIDELLEAELLLQSSPGHYSPSVLVMNIDEVELHMPVSDELVTQTVELVTRASEDVESQYHRLSGFSHVPFKQASLLILSDVLLDNWQINAIEREFLQAERPLRAGKRYYFSLQEKAQDSNLEAFGIYGNQYRGIGAYTVGVYGNQRSNNPLNIQTLDAESIERLFGASPESVPEYKQYLLDGFMKIHEGIPSPLTAAEINGFEQIGWLSDGAIRVPVLTKEENQALYDMARLITGDLVELFEQYRPALESSYQASPYFPQVTFEEYFMWWFHLYYTAATDKLIADGDVLYPPFGITSYILLRE